MKQIFLVLPLLVSLMAQAAPSVVPDIPPDAESSMYRSVMSPQQLKANFDGLDDIVALGERNMQWLGYINSFRQPGDKISLTSKDSQRGIPIDKPSEYNVPLIQEKLAVLRPQLPASMQSVLFDGAEFTKEPPVALADYKNWSREVDRVYQSALRWRMMAGWLDYLSENRHRDIRGWYFLSRLENRAEKLKNFRSLDGDEQAQIREWLTSMCFNEDRSDDRENCAGSIDRLIQVGSDLEAYYSQKARISQSIFDEYFTIPSYAPRQEIQWEGDHLVAPFADPGREDARAFLQDNIQDEWRFESWYLALPIVNSGWGIPRMEFESGATPHVNGLGGDVITMNAEQPLTEYDAQWTIRHEYGHVLGFPDCYVEFYEPERNVIVNYQFDTENLMCSRRGHIQQRHVDELLRAYSR